MSLIKPKFKTVAWVTFVYLLIFGLYYLYQKNYEFVFYVGVVFFFFWVVLKSSHKIDYSPLAAWGLSVWAFLHMAGGGLQFGGGRLYDFMIFRINETYNIFRYDQFVHILGFFVATIVMWEILKPHLSEKHGWVGVGIVVVMAGLGLGALNEILEFSATVVLPATGVGGYINTSMDLVADIIGALLAWVVIVRREGKA